MIPDPTDPEVSYNTRGCRILISLTKEPMKEPLALLQAQSWPWTTFFQDNRHIEDAQNRWMSRPAALNPYFLERQLCGDGREGDTMFRNGCEDLDFEPLLSSTTAEQATEGRTNRRIVDGRRGSPCRGLGQH